MTTMLESVRKEVAKEHWHAQGQKLYLSIHDELPALERGTFPDLCRHLMKRYDSLFHTVSNVNLADDEVCRAAVSSAAIADTFSTVIGNKMILAASEEPDSTLGWVVETSAVNFLPAVAFTLEGGARLHKLQRGRPAEHISFGAKGEAWAIGRFGAQFVLDEQAMLDGGHVGAVLLGAGQMGAAAARLRADLIYALLLGNPTLSADNVALFHTTHSNIASGGGSALSATSLATAVGAIGLQHLTDDHGDAIHSNLQAKYLVVPPQLVVAGKTAVRNTVLGDGNDYEVRQESRLSALGVVNPKTDAVATESATNWLLAARGSSRPSVVVGGLNGDLKPQVRQSTLDRGQWGLSWDILLDIGAAALDYRGVYYSVGA